jgi:hypothetical protein
MSTPAALLVLTFGFTWLLEIPMVLDARGELPFGFQFWGVLLMGWMPGLATVIMGAAILTYRRQQSKHVLLNLTPGKGGHR